MACGPSTMRGSAVIRSSSTRPASSRSATRAAASPAPWPTCWATATASPRACTASRGPDMDSIRDTRLKSLRAAPAHTQLLPPLPPSLALCGADGAVGVHVPFEHRQLLPRLDRLRYEVEGR